VSRQQVRFWRVAVPDAASQGRRIARTFPQFRRVRDERSIEWRGTLCPRPGCDYTVRIKYQGRKSPKVFLIDPEVDERCPHIWRDKSLCLFWSYDPENRGWQPDSWIAETIIPWTAVWLHYYELWLETGEWRGPDKEHGPQIAE